MRLRPPLLLLALLLASGPISAADLCPWPTTVRGTVSCPVGVSSSICASSSGAPLTYAQADRNFLNTVGLCAAEDRIVVTDVACSADELPVFGVDGWTCSALSALPGRISSGQLPLSFNAPTASALAANPAACTSGQYATDIAADGTLTCAQVAYSQISGTPASGIVGSLGLTARYFPRAAGTDGVTLEPSPNWYQRTNGDVVLEDYSGSRCFWFSSVPTAPMMCRSGANLAITGNEGGPVQLQVGSAWFNNPSGETLFSGDIMVSNGRKMCFSDGADFNRCLKRFPTGIMGISDYGGTAAVGWQVKGIIMVPQASPPWSCDADHDGAEYRDSSGAGTKCECYYASGDGWVNTQPGRSGSNCS